VRLTRSETRARRVLHEERYDELIRRFRQAGMDPVTLDDAAPERIHRVFLSWAARRARALRSAR
jgi:low affinity Fe/Cu permease